MGSTKGFIYPTITKLSNSVQLAVGNVANAGFNTNNNTANNIYILVAYKVAETAIVGSASITLEVDLYVYSNPATARSIINTGTVNIISYTPDTMVNIKGINSFRIKLKLKLLKKILN